MQNIATPLLAILMSMRKKLIFPHLTYDELNREFETSLEKNNISRTNHDGHCLGLHTGMGKFFLL